MKMPRDEQCQGHTHTQHQPAPESLPLSNIMTGFKSILLWTFAL